MVLGTCHLPSLRLMPQACFPCYLGEPPSHPPLISLRGIPVRCEYVPIRLALEIRIEVFLHSLSSSKAVKCFHPVLALKPAVVCK